MSNEFLELVTQRHNPKLKYGKIKCPFCGSSKTEIKMGEQTLVGNSPGFPDSNHHWDHGTCKKCWKTFIIDSRTKGIVLQKNTLCEK